MSEDMVRARSRRLVLSPSARAVVSLTRAQLLIMAGVLGIVVSLAGGPGSATATTLAPGTPQAEEFVLGPTTPGKWGDPTFGTGATITWSLITTPIACGNDGTAACTSIVPLSTFMPAGFETEIERAFASWSAAADLTFLEVVDSGLAFNASGAAGDIRVGGHAFDGAGGTLAHGFFPPANGVSAAGDIHFDIAETWKIGLGGAGFDIFHVAAHEIGHAIGLDHTDNIGALMDTFYTEAFSGPQADDIAGAQFVYGEPQTAVPEPGSLVLVSSAFAIYAIRWRMRRNQA